MGSLQNRTPCFRHPSHHVNTTPVRTADRADMDDYLESTIRLYLARAASPVVHQQSHSILFTLPAKLREEIYKQCPAETFTAVSGNTT